MVYFINGQRLDYHGAVVLLLNAAHAFVTCAWDELLRIVENFLRSVKPGTGRYYANLRISCARF